ncbi:MAG: RdgB/HAM1 family non-canonical purine NTP pyrophosphatase [Acidobacteriaceae bacterium]
MATSNPGKLRDFSALLSPGEIELELMPANALQPAPAETGATFEENARIKAIQYSQRLPGELVLADDSGLEVDALDGAPGVHSARYAALEEFANSHENSPDDANNARLLRELDRVPDAQRTARFLCVLALARAGEVLKISRGTVEGMILREQRGSGGFGYDPLFMVPELGVTFAQISTEQKGENSHRGRAFRAMLEKIGCGIGTVEFGDPVL